MPIHLLSLAVGKFRVIEAFSQSDGTKISVYIPSEWPQNASEMLDKAVQAYDKLTDSF